MNGWMSSARCLIVDRCFGVAMINGMVLFLSLLFLIFLMFNTVIQLLHVRCLTLPFMWENDVRRAVMWCSAFSESSHQMWPNRFSFICLCLCYYYYYYYYSCSSFCYNMWSAFVTFTFISIIVLYSTLEIIKNLWINHTVELNINFISFWIITFTIYKYK